MNNDISDKALISKAVNGSKSAFEALMNRYLDMLYSYISLRASEADAADILQETMLAVWQGLGGYDNRSSLKTWLFAVARRKLCDFYRKRSRESQNECTFADILPDSCEDGFCDVDSGEDLAAQTVERLDTADAIKRLNESERELVHLIFDAGLSYTEISEVIGVPVGTIKSRMSAIKSKLKYYLEVK
ncbi:MAG: RNA polymerase sigma factor [Clostridiales bacterium]|nr:RNA polymerase sigma factor [Clostridiales bacterium]